MREFEERIPQATDHRAAVAAIVDRIFFLRNKHRGIERVFTAMSFSDPDVARIRAEFIALRVKHITPFVEMLVPKSRAPVPAATAHVLQTTVMAMATEDVRLGCKVGDLKHALVEMIYAYLFAPSDSR